MHNTPLISVIIPVYNVEKYLRKCVDSFLTQTYQNLEIILVDDGSRDTCARICDEYGKKYDNIRVIHQENGGVSSARNAGIKAARGKYIAFTDGDDWVESNFIKALWQTANKYHAPMAIVGRCFVLHDKTRDSLPLPSSQKEKVIISPEGCFNKRQALTMTFSPYGYFVTNKLFDISLFERTLFPTNVAYEDIWILYRIFQQVNKLAICNLPLSYWNRQNEESQSRGRLNKYMLDYFAMTDDFLVEAKKLRDNHLWCMIERERLAHICGFFKRMMICGFNNWQVIKSMQQELRHNLWLLLLHPWPLHVTAFGICCAISFKLTRKLFLSISRV